jgi:chaperone LolA
VKRFIAVTGLLLMSSLTAAAQTELDRAAAAMSGTEASFTHRFSAKGFKKPQVESGSVVFGDLPAMRWSYAKPEKKTFVFDGSNSWFYVPADKQVTVSRVDAAQKRELPFLLLGDPAARNQHFVVTEQKKGGKVVTTLQPKNAGSAIRTATLTINPSTHLIERIDYTDRDGNQTSFSLAGYRRRAVNAAMFRFDPPAGVQVVRAGQ